MPLDHTRRTLRVFLSCPADVAEERKIVKKLLRSVLPNDPAFPPGVSFEVIGWEDMVADAPMPTPFTPRKAIGRFGYRPADCDIMIIVLAARMGTRLDVTGPKRRDGTAYRSGVEWEFENALSADNPPHILIYRRMDLPQVALRDPHLQEKLHQFQSVERFFERFREPAVSRIGSFHTDSGTEAFRQAVTRDLMILAQESVDSHDSPVPRPPLARVTGRRKDAAAHILPPPDGPRRVSHQQIKAAVETVIRNRNHIDG
jgi:hypothetical protein